MGWGVLCLDPHEFISTTTFVETWGGLLAPNIRFRDITPSVREVQDNPVPDSRPLIPFPPQQDEPSDSSEGIDGLTDEDSLHEAVAYTTLELPVAPTAGTDSADSSFVDELSTHEEEPSADQKSIRIAEAKEHGIEDNDSDRAVPLNIRPMEENDTVWEGPLKIGIERSKTNENPFAVFHTTAQSMRLFVNPMDQIEISCQLRKPLCQTTLGGEHTAIHGAERLNMVTHVPELGVVIAGSAGGRVAILSLTRREITQDLAFRLDHILPFKRQEDRKERPFCALVGVAIAPLQGFELPSDEFRSHGIDRNESWRSFSRTGREYRLMLTYLDGSVLSYKVARALYPREDRGFNPLFER